jgi:hypothetical protein
MGTDTATADVAAMLSTNAATIISILFFPSFSIFFVLLVKLITPVWEDPY